MLSFPHPSTNLLSLLLLLHSLLLSLFSLSFFLQDFFLSYCLSVSVLVFRFSLSLSRHPYQMKEASVFLYSQADEDESLSCLFDAVTVATPHLFVRLQPLTSNS